MVCSGALQGEAPGGCKGAAPDVAGQGLSPGDAERAVSACPLGVVVSKPPQKHNWCLGSVLLFIVKERGFFISFFFPVSRKREWFVCPLG